MKIAFVSNDFYDPTNPDSWSGLPYFIHRALGECGVESECVRLRDPARALTVFNYAYYRYFRKLRYVGACDRLVLKSYARQLDRRLVELQVDVVFSPSSRLIAYSRTKLPVVFWTDACFASMVGFYQSFADLSPRTLRDGHHAEQSALDVCTKAIYSSEWAAQTAIACYKVPPAKISVVPFGANLVERPAAREVEAMIQQRSASRCELTLVGVDWKRKGVDQAIQVAQLLNERGVPTRLTVVGCRPPAGAFLPDCVELVPYLAKNSPAGRKGLNAIYARSHFLIVPSLAEAYGLVFAEAGAFGVPSLATDVGGIPSIIGNDVNGRLFSLHDPADRYADYICALWREPARYQSLALRSAQEARERFSWEVSAPAVTAIFEAARGPLRHPLTHAHRHIHVPA